MSPDQCQVLFKEHGRITVMLCLDEENGARLQVGEKDATLNLRLHNVVVNPITQVGVGPEQRSLQVRVHEGFQLIDVCIIHP